MKKYWHVVNVGIQNTLVYRVNFLFRSTFALVPLTATIFLWRAIYQGPGTGPEVAGYSLGRMISYYLIIMVIDALTGVTDDDWQIAADIREGNISQFLLKPIDYLTYRLCLFGAGRVVYAVVAAVPVGLFILYYHRWFYVPAASTFVWFLGSLVLTALLQFFISYTLALMAFWVLEVSTLIFMVFALENLAGGHLFPLDILPPAIAKLLAFTPFPYQLYLPAAIYLEQTTGAARWRGLLLQAGWVLGAYFMARYVWRRGMKHYSAVGG